MSLMKRIADLLVSSFGLALASPFMLLIAVLIKCESKGPIFYSCSRVGRKRKLFGMLKFRTMVENADRVDCKLCAGGDVRVTDLGRFLRRTKLNELPQLFNVFKGDMSIVGPRPEDPKFMPYYPEKWDVVLSVRPGIFGPNQIANRNEEDLFPEGVDPEKFYIERILPEKLERDIAYAKNPSLIRDFGLILGGVYVTLFKGVRLKNVTIDSTTLNLAAWDILLSGMAYTLANYLKYESLSFDRSILTSLAFVIVANPVMFFCMGLYKRSVRFFAYSDFIHLGSVCGLSLALLLVFNYFFMIGTGFSRLVYFLYPIILLVFLTAERGIRRVLMERKEILSKKSPRPNRAVIYGAGRKGTELLRRLQFEPECQVIGFVDDDPTKKNKSIMGVKVLGTGLDMPFLRSLHAVEKVYVSFDPVSTQEIDHVSKVRDAGVDDILIETSVFEVVGDSLTLRNHYRALQFSDTIGLKTASLQRHPLHSNLSGSSVAIVGAGDPMGEELCSELIALGVKDLVIIEDCEARLERINQFLGSNGRARISHHSYFVPLGTLPVAERHIAQHGVKWMIYNGLNRRVSQKCVTWPGLDLLRRAAVIQFVNLADRIGCDAFTFVSPLGKAGVSARERELALLMESFISYWTSQDSNEMRLATVRPATVIEDENDIFSKCYNLVSRAQCIEVPQKPIRLTSAKNAARFVVNSYPLHNKGAVFMDVSSVAYDLKTLITECFKFCGDKTPKTGLIKPLPEQEADSFADGSEDLLDCVETEVSSILKLNRPNHPHPHPGTMKSLEDLQNLCGLNRNVAELENFSILLSQAGSATERRAGR